MVLVSGLGYGGKQAYTSRKAVEKGKVMNGKHIYTENKNKLCELCHGPMTEVHKIAVRTKTHVLENGDEMVQVVERKDPAILAWMCAYCDTPRAR